MRAISEIGRQEADERLVLVVSDADLQRYNIDVRQWNEILQKDPAVKAYVILISNNVDEAPRVCCDLCHLRRNASSPPWPPAVPTSVRRRQAWR